MFTQEEESLLVDHIKVMSEIGYGYTRQETINLATDYAQYLGHGDRTTRLSLRWLYNFLSRWPEIENLKPRKLEYARARSATRSSVDNYFNELEKIMNKYSFQHRPHQIYNIDEKGLQTDITPPKLVSSTRCKPQAVTTGKSKTVTVIGAGNASGNAIPPYFVFPGQRMRDDLMEGASPGADGTVSETGWSNTDIFNIYMKSHFVKYAATSSAESLLLVLYDGHKSHVSIGLIQWAKEHNIVLFVLPPHTSHLLQPLDIGCYGPVEAGWTSACHRHLRESGGKAITRYDVCKIAC
ncbi:MFS-type transporter clz9-like [Haliotis rubra]|uniref:MFS-type transporter clz9-like n=1 Tax=Haliotis rubra TaxID=36100 RepID=UPI001EE591AC|nr:MFS-type transporter clz9-like [Haliotis rubra]